MATVVVVGSTASLSRWPRPRLADPNGRGARIWIEEIGWRGALPNLADGIIQANIAALFPPEDGVAP